MFFIVKQSIVEKEEPGIDQAGSWIFLFERAIPIVLTHTWLLFRQLGIMDRQPTDSKTERSGAPLDVTESKQSTKAWNIIGVCTMRIYVSSPCIQTQHLSKSMNCGCR